MEWITGAMPSEMDQVNTFQYLRFTAKKLRDETIAEGLVFLSGLQVPKVV